MAVVLQTPTLQHAAAFLKAVRQSEPLHAKLVAPPRTRARYRAYLTRLEQATHVGHLVCLPNGELAGVINISEIVRGLFHSAYLGYYAFVPHAGAGHMRAGLALVLGRAFRSYGLHRLEANIQPTNQRSIELVKSLGFRLEGFSPRYLKIDGRWRDHERWAITREDWLKRPKSAIASARISPRHS